MQAFMIEGAECSRFVDVPKPAIENGGSVLVKVESCGICGTDIRIFEGAHSQSVGRQRIPGHEFAGVVVETGADVRSLRPGDRVVHEPIAYCGSCYACSIGQGNVCSSLAVTGCNCSGGMAEYFAAPERQWHRIPDWMTWEQAALVEPYTIAAQVCARAELRPRETLLIHGAGPIGLMLADTAMLLGADVAVSEVKDGRLALACGFGVPHVIDARARDVKEEALRLTGGVGFNVICDCAGLRDMSEAALDMLSPAGRFVPVAGVPFVLDGYKAMRKQAKVVASRLQMDQFIPVIRRFALFREHAQEMITDVFPFSKTKEAFLLAAARLPETGKIILRFS